MVSVLKIYLKMEQVTGIMYVSLNCLLVRQEYSRIAWSIPGLLIPWLYAAFVVRSSTAVGCNGPSILGKNSNISVRK